MPQKNSIETEIKKYELYKVEYKEPFDMVCHELKEICDLLSYYLPDTTLSPTERVERLARVVPNSVLLSQNNYTGRTKLRELRTRLDALVPQNIGYLDKIEVLINKVNLLAPSEETMAKKLEKIGDHRRSDIGR